LRDQLVGKITNKRRLSKITSIYFIPKSNKNNKHFMKMLYIEPIPQMEA